ncbi:MAG: hypothetical protein IJZ39_06170 [Oscillospiraceae bacterium]|nr:hypothetical protein [Oscillospiraceae bacterium]
MKKTAKLFIALLLLLAIPVSLLTAGALLPDFYGDTYYAVLSRMYERLETAGKPKIIVVGGSNVAFGLDGALLEALMAQQGYDYTVCPFGLYAAVGTSAMLDLSRDCLNAGDIVVLAVEPTSETMSAYFGAEAFWKCAEGDASLIAKLSREKQAALAGNYIPHVQQRYQILTSGDYPIAQGVYAASSFDGRCDMIFDRPGNAMAVGYDTASPVDLASVQIGADFADQVNEFCALAQRKGASVVMSFSPVNRAGLTDGSEKAVSAFFTACNTAFDCPMISDPNRYILDRGWFYDSNFHLNSAGAQLRTCLLAEDLLAWLGCYREIGFEVPAMPASIAQVQDHDANEDYFTFAPVDGGWLIAGLTERGLEQIQLQVPAAHQGKPVIGFTSDALHDADVLAELRLPETIESLPDGLFRDAGNLTRLVLEHTGSVCSVGEDVFRDADQIRIYVPASVYPMYRDGYGCETNLWEPYLDRIHPLD